MVNKRNFILGIILLACILLINIAFVSAQGLYCCERTKIESDGSGGAWCINANESKCDTSINPDTNEPYRSVSTSCEATFYCRSGTCINTEDGVCMENTPEIVCNKEGGFWKAEKPDELPQCQLGCCLIGEQAAFVTLTRCKKLSSLYELETNYRADIQSEIQCIASAMPKVKGACVFEREYQRTCLLLTKKECQEMGAEFHEGYLCSATNLSTNCGRSTKTTCVEGRDEVYFLDTCGNLANVYDADKEEGNENYWTYIAGTQGVEVCSPASSTCGNCDYFLGTTCKSVGGKHICQDLSCEYKGNPYQHGETWCAEAEGVSRITATGGVLNSSGEDFPGGRYFRLVCYNGDVTVEPCADFRQEVCIQSEVNTFRTAACRVNMWQDCYSQDNVKDCENPDKRDCQVIEGFSILKDENGESLFRDEEGDITEASCVPKYAPGFDFWESGGDAESMCSLASTQCVVEYEKGLLGKKKIVKGEECVQDDDGDGEWDIKNSWITKINDFCMSLGDCGSKTNYLKEDGYYDDPSDFIARSSGEEDEED